MKKTSTATTPATVTVIDTLRTLTPRQTLDRKAFKEVYNDVKQIHNIVYKVYQGREKGKPIDESAAMSMITTILHKFGKANGKYISVCEPTTDGNGKPTVFFEVLVYHSFNDDIVTTSESLASLKAKKATAGKKKAQAHKALLNEKGTAKAYKEACKVVDELAEQIKALQAEAGNEKAITAQASETAFAKFFFKRLTALIEKRYALSAEEAEKARKLHNKAKKDAKKQGKGKQKPAKADKPAQQGKDKKPATK